MALTEYIDQIAQTAGRARSEAKLEGELNQILKNCLSDYGIAFNPYVNETLKGMGLSQVDADRPDGVFGHIVYDYKKPGTLSSVKGLVKAKAQMERYLRRISAEDSTTLADGSDWFGYVIDGRSIAYCRSVRRSWQWSRALPITESTLLLLVHAYRSLKRKPLTAQLLSDAFGKHAVVAQEVIRVMCSHLAKPRHRTNMLFREWKRLFEQVSTYGLEQLPSLKAWASQNGIATKDASHILFAMHSYYSLVVKILTCELLSISGTASFSVCEEMIGSRSAGELRKVMKGIEDGEYYRRYRISNFLEGDFFSWYVNEESEALAQAIREVGREFLQFEPASAVLRPEDKQDLLKEFYSSLVDEQIRHDLGEYYTPDWLAQHLLDRADYKGELNQTVLDPACGSGTFLVETISRLKIECEKAGYTETETLSKILSNVKGLDLNPLAVISARANYILSIYDIVFDLGHDIEIPVYLADTINIPIEKEDKSGHKYLEYLLDTELGDFVLELPCEIVQGGVVGEVLLDCEEVISGGRSFDHFLRKLQSSPRVSAFLARPVVDRLRQFFAIIESLENRNWDKIWCRIIKNNFSPRSFDRFDLIVGNPPWVRWSRLPEGYRDRVKTFCSYYGLVSGKGYTGGIESDISTVITFSAADNWLRNGGTIAFLLTWTVFKSESARGFRLSELPRDSGLLIEMIEDLTRLQPFPDASNQTSVYVATKVNAVSKARFERVDCKIWEPLRGRSRISPNASLASVYESCKIRDGIACPVREWGTPLFTGSPNHFERAAFLRGQSDYLERAHRGTVSDCARVYWVKVLKYSSSTGRALIRTLTEEELPRARTVDPVDGAWIESDLLYPLIRGRDLGRYCTQTEGWYQLVPNLHYDRVEPEENFADSYPLAYSYFKNYEDILLNRSSYKRYQSHLPFYVIYCVGDYSLDQFKVVWMEQQNPNQFRAAVVSSLKNGVIPNNVVVPDHKLYFVSLRSEEEAHYVCGFLNSYPVRTWLGGFLLGKQIGTTIFEYMKVPNYDRADPSSRAIVELSLNAHKARGASREKRFLDAEGELRLSQYVREVAGRTEGGVITFDR